MYKQMIIFETKVSQFEKNEYLSFFLFGTKESFGTGINDRPLQKLSLEKLQRSD
jgi:hypothetical protein